MLLSRIATLQHTIISGAIYSLGRPVPAVQFTFASSKKINKNFLPLELTCRAGKIHSVLHSEQELQTGV